MILTVWCGGNVMFGVIVPGIWFLRVVWSCANSSPASLSRWFWEYGMVIGCKVLGIWPDGGLDDRVQVLMRGKFVVVVYVMKVAS